MPSGAAALDRAVILGTGMMPQLLPTGKHLPDIVARRVQFETEVSCLMGAPRSLVISEAKVVGDISAHEELFARRSAILNARMLDLADAMFARVWARSDERLQLRCAVRGLRSAYDDSLARYATEISMLPFSEFSARDAPLNESVVKIKAGVKRKREFGAGVHARFECTRALRVVSEYQRTAPVFEWAFVRNCFSKSLGVPLDVISKTDPFRQNDAIALAQARSSQAGAETNGRGQS